MPSPLRKALENLKRNWLTTIPAMVVGGIILTLFHGLLLVHSQARTMLEEIEKKVSLTVYLKDDVDPFEVGNLITALEERADVVKPVTYTSKEEAWKSVSETFNLDFGLLKKYKFSLPASLTITPQTPQDLPVISAFLQTKAKQLLKPPQAVGGKSEKLTNQMLEFIERVKTGSLRYLVLFIILFIASSIVLLGSVIHLALSFRYREITIMKLVGASYGTIIRPFVMEGVLLSLAAFIIHLALLVLITGDSALFLSKFHLNTLTIELAAVLALGIAVSYATTLLHIRRKSKLL